VDEVRRKLTARIRDGDAMENTTEDATTEDATTKDATEDASDEAIEHANMAVAVDAAQDTTQQPRRKRKTSEEAPAEDPEHKKARVEAS
jgi:hypothetical protein